MTWTAVPGAVSYRIYGPAGTAGGGQDAFPSQNSKTRYGTSTTNSFTYSVALPNTGTPPALTTGANAAAIKMLADGTARFAGQIESRAATGTAPFIVTSTSEVANLNAQRWHGKEALDFSASLDFGSIAAQSCSELNISVTGASVNNAVSPAWPTSLEAGLTGIMRVSTSDSVAVRLCNVTVAAIDPASQTFGGRVIQ